MLYVPHCSLCRLWHDREIATALHYEDDLIIIVDCSKCKVPMIVVKRHDVRVTPEEMSSINEVTLQLWPGATLRCAPRAVKDHFHCHVVI